MAVVLGAAALAWLVLGWRRRTRPYVPLLALVFVVPLIAGPLAGAPPREAGPAPTHAASGARAPEPVM